MNFNRETDPTSPAQPDSSPLASLGRSIQARAGWNRRALSPWVQRRLESTQPGSSARARSFTLIRPPVQAMLVGQLQRTSEETFVSRPTIGSVNPLLVENFTQEVAGRHAQQIEPKYQPQTSDTWANAPADLTWSGLTKAEETQAQQPPAPAPLPFTVDQVRQAIERQQAGLPPLPTTSSPTPPPASTQTVQPKRETAFPFSVAEVRAALEQPHFAKAPEIKSPSTPPPSSRQRRWVEEVTPPAAGPAVPSADPPGSFSQPEIPAAELPQPPAKAPASPLPVQRQVEPPFEPLRQSTAGREPEPEQMTGIDEPEDIASSLFTGRHETATPPARAVTPPTPPVQLKPQPVARPVEGSASTQPTEPARFSPPSAQTQRPASAPVQRQMPSRPRPPRSEPVWQTLDPTNLPSNRMSESDQPEPEPDEFFLGDEPAQTLTPIATGPETALPTSKSTVQRQPAVETPPPSEVSPALEMPLRLPQTEPAESAQTVEPSTSEGEAAQPPSKPTVQRQPAFEAPLQPESRLILDMPQTEPDKVAQVVEPSPITPSASEGEAAQPPSKTTAQRQPTFEASSQREPSSLEMPLRQPELRADEAAQIVESSSPAPSASEGEATQPPTKSAVQRQPEPSLLEMPLRLPQVEPEETIQAVGSSQADALSSARSETAISLPGQPIVQHPAVEIPRQREQASPLEMPLRQPQAEPDEVAQTTAPAPTFSSTATAGETAPPAGKSAEQRQQGEGSPQAEKSAALEMPLRQPEPGPDETTDLSEITTSMTGREVTSSPNHPPVQRHLAFEPQTEPPSSLEMPLRLPEIEPNKIVPPIEPSQAAAPGVAESPVPSAYSQPAAQRQPIPESQHPVEPLSDLEMPLRFPQAEPGTAAQSVEPSPASAINQAAPLHQAAVQRQPQSETPLRQTEPEPVEPSQTSDLSPTKTPDAEWSDFDGPEGTPLRQAETERVHPARQIGVLPQVRQPFEARAEGMPVEPEKTGEPVLPLAQPLSVRPEAAARLDMPLAAPPQPAPKASERGEAASPSTATPAMSIQRYWESEAASSSSTAVDSEIGPIQRVEDTEISFSEESESPAAELSLDDLARQVYPLVKRMLAVERDRRPFR